MTNQLPAPDNISDELGYDAPGSDMSGVQPPPTDPATNQLPYAQSAEVGWLYGEDMTELASSDPIPVANDFGAPSDMGSLNRSDVASSAGFHVVDSFDDMYGNTPGRQQASGSLPPGPSKGPAVVLTLCRVWTWDGYLYPLVHRTPVLLVPQSKVQYSTVGLQRALTNRRID